MTTSADEIKTAKIALLQSQQDMAAKQADVAAKQAELNRLLLQKQIDDLSV